MKKYFIPLLVALLIFSSCKKGTDGTSNTLLLAEIYRNGHLDNQYIYSTDKRLIRFNEYSANNNQSNLFVYVNFEYGPDGYIKHRKVFAPNDTLNNRYELSFDNAGRLSRMDWFFPGNTLSDYRLYEYDQHDRIIKINEKKPDHTNKAYSEYTYDEEGRLKTQKRYVWSVDKFKLNYEYTFTGAGKNVYSHWKKFMTSPFDFSWPDINMGSRNTLFYDGNGNITSNYMDSASNKKYNGSGYLVSQTITRKHIKPVKPSDVWELEYMYLQ